MSAPPAVKPKAVSKQEQYFLLALLAALGFASWVVFRRYAGWIFFALFVGYMAFPARNWLVAHRVPRWLSAGALTFVAALLIIAPFAFIGWQLSDEVGRAAQLIDERGPAFFARRFARAVGIPPEVISNVGSAARGLLASVAQQSVAVATEVGVGAILAFFLLFSVLYDGDRLVDWLYRTMPLSEGRRETLVAETKKALDGVIFGVMAVAVAQGAAAAIGWWLFGLPEPLFWGFVLIIASLIPYLGAYLVLVPANVWFFATGDLPRAVGFLLFSIFVVGTVDNVVRPILIGKRGGIHPGVVLVGVVGGVPAFGGIGIILGPIVLALLIAVINVLARPQKAERDGLALKEEEAVQNAARLLDEADAERAEATRAASGDEDEREAPGGTRSGAT